MQQTVEHPTLGELKLVGSPLAHLSRTPATLKDPPPRLGEHTEEVLRGVLGLSEAEVAALEQAGAVRTLNRA